jgi:hypothetical protein
MSCSVGVTTDEWLLNTANYDSKPGVAAENPNRDPLHFVEGYLVAGAVVEFCHAGLSCVAIACAFSNVPSASRAQVSQCLEAPGTTDRVADCALIIRHGNS